MKLLIHDLTEDIFQEFYPQIAEDDIVITDDGSIRSCIGCFGCWLKTPGACIIKDNYNQIGKNIAMCSEIHIISKCIYGGYSPFVKNVLDRSISYVHPYFAIVNGEMHHQQRYKKAPSMKVTFYGDDISSEEKEIARKLVEANAVNLYCTVDSVAFLDFLPQQEMED